MKRILKAVDGSVNYIIPFRGANVEARYVRRSPHYISAYVSSHNGCNMGCKFCFLTQQGQTKMNPVAIAGPGSYADQLATILRAHASSTLPSAERNPNIRVNVNFMARGEPLANPSVTRQYPELHTKLTSVAASFGHSNTLLNISTIMPLGMRHLSLIDVFQNKPVRLYYSLYSTNDHLKRSWMPKALPHQLALEKLATYQKHVCSQQANVHNSDNIDGVVHPQTFHWTFIKGFNDSEDSCYKMVNTINQYEFPKTRFSMIAFNPGQLKETAPEPEKLKALFQIISQNLKHQVSHVSHTLDSSRFNGTRSVERVGFEAYASCGMFIQD